MNGNEKNATYPLSFILFPALGHGDVVLEHGVVGPQAQLGQRRPPREQVQYAAHDGLLLAAQLDAAGRLDVGVLNVEVCGGSLCVNSSTEGRESDRSG